MEDDEGEIVRARIGVVDDHPAIIRGLQASLDGHAELSFAAGGRTVAELLGQTRELDLVLLDLRLDDGSSPQHNVTTLLEADIPSIAYTSGDEPYLVRIAAAAGVLGVLRKNVTDDVLLDACRQALRGEEVPTVDWAAALDSDADFVDLSPQLRRVLEGYASGQSSAVVARSLGLSVDTVSDYVTRIRNKYAAVGRPAPTKQHLLMRAIEDGWVPLPRRRRRPRP